MAKVTNMTPRLNKKGKTAKPKTKAKVKPQPRTAPLPGMEDMRDSTMSRCARTVADARATISEATEAERDASDLALKRMHELKRMTFQAHGVRFERRLGIEKLSVRIVKDKTTKDAPPVTVDLVDADEPKGEEFAEK